MEGYVDPDANNALLKNEESLKDEEGENWAVDFFTGVERMAAIGRQMRYGVAQQAVEELAKGADPFTVARMVTEFSLACDALEGLPELAHRAIQIMPDPEPQPKPGRYLGRTEDPPSAEP